MTSTKDIMYRKYADLTRQEKRYYTMNRECRELNECDRCLMIDSTYALRWGMDFHLEGHDCLCDDCYDEVGGTPRE